MAPKGRREKQTAYKLWEIGKEGLLLSFEEKKGFICLYAKDKKALATPGWISQDQKPLHFALFIHLGKKIA